MSVSLTGKGSRHKNRGEATDAADKRSTRDMPILTTNIVAIAVATTIDDDAHYNKDLA